MATAGNRRERMWSLRTAALAVVVALLVLPLVLAPHAEAYVYWTNTYSVKRAIGRAALDGTTVDPSFIAVSAPRYPAGVTVDTRHVYWTNYLKGIIGRATLDGTKVDPPPRPG